jgi:probable F420-dependent oxidoreductase
VRPFQFMVGARDVVDARTIAERARWAESIGITHVAVHDHLSSQLAPMTVLTAVAAATDRLRLCPLVFNNDLRHPAVLAQDLASIDVLSGGRLDIAIGAGWRKVEYDAIGLPFDDGPVRVSRLEESIAVLKACFADESASFHGSHYRLDDFDGQPKPVQRPHPPLLIGGGGKRILSIAGREAQVVGLAPRQLAEQRVDPRSITWDATTEKIGWARAAAGDRADELVINVYPSAWPPTVTDDARSVAREVIDGLRGRTGIELTEEEVLESPHLFIGSIDGLVDKFQALREGLGISSIMVGDLDELRPVVERLAGT